MLIKKDEILRLGKDIRTGGTKNISIKDIKILCDSSGTDESSGSALKTGDADLRPLSTPLKLKTHITISFMTLSPYASLLRNPPIELLKLTTIRLSKEDLF